MLPKFKVRENEKLLVASPSVCSLSSAFLKIKTCSIIVSVIKETLLFTKFLFLKLNYLIQEKLFFIDNVHKICSGFKFKFAVQPFPTNRLRFALLELNFLIISGLKNKRKHSKAQPSSFVYRPKSKLLEKNAPIR